MIDQRRILNCLWVFPAFLAFMSPFSSAAPGTVYMAMGSDTAVWNVPGGVAANKYRMHFDPAIFTSPYTNAYGCLNAEFRNRFLDSYGQPLKMTWWMLVGSVYGKCDNNDIPVPNLMPLYLMRKYHGNALKELGDELLVDIARYKNHPDCSTLVCFVYDPEQRINNPAGLKHDLEGNSSEALAVKVYICQH